jgi:hypothetical protein
LTSVAELPLASTQGTTAEIHARDPFPKSNLTVARLRLATILTKEKATQQKLSLYMVSPTFLSSIQFLSVALARVTKVEVELYANRSK